MTDYRSILKRVGVAFIAFGLVDIALMIYAVSNGHSYASSFNIFAVIAGIFLWRGNLGIARRLTWFFAFMLTSFIGAFSLLVPLLFPLDLLIIQAKLNPMFFLVGTLITLATLVLIGWSYRQLGSAPVLDALKASGRNPANPKLAIGAGVAFVALFVVVLSFTIKGSAGDKAIELAREQLGPGYNYVPQSLNNRNGHTTATVAAYNDSELQYVRVEWGE